MLQGILNVWHLVAYQKYYDGLVRAALPAEEQSKAKQQAVERKKSASFLDALNDQGSNVVEVGRLFDVSPAQVLSF